jgi:murein DD-endopeptidase MepM/ murein hydrolase activator NlpD
VEDEVVEVPASEAVIQFKFPLHDFKRVSRGFKGRHRGIDVSAQKGTPIYAAEDGWVTYEGRKFHGYGKLIILEHSKTWATFYAHMSAFEAKEGTWVKKGDTIGYVGSTGRSTGSHLHFEIRYKNKAINPLPYFDADRLKFAHSKP